MISWANINENSYQKVSIPPIHADFKRFNLKFMDAAPAHTPCHTTNYHLTTDQAPTRLQHIMHDRTAHSTYCMAQSLLHHHLQQNNCCCICNWLKQAHQCATACSTPYKFVISTIKRMLDLVSIDTLQWLQLVNKTTIINWQLHNNYHSLHHTTYHASACAASCLFSHSQGHNSYSIVWDLRYTQLIYLFANFAH